MYKFKVENTRYEYLITLSITAIAIDILCFGEYIYIRWYIMPSNMILHGKKSRTRLFYVIFNTKEVLADTLQLVVGIKLQEYILYFASGEEKSYDPGAIIFAQFLAVSVFISLFVFLNTAMESYIEMIEVHPYNATKNLLRVLSIIKYAFLIGMFIMILTQSIIPQNGINDFYLVNKFEKANHLAESYNYTTDCGDNFINHDCNQLDHRYSNITSRVQVEMPCTCVQEKCYSSNCGGMEDRLRRVNCSIKKQLGYDQDCGKLFTGKEQNKNFSYVQ